MNIGVVPWSKHFLKNELFSLDSALNYDERLRPFYEMKKTLQAKGWSINTIDCVPVPLQKLDVILFFSLDYEILFKTRKSIFKGFRFYFAWEPEVVTREHTKINLLRLRAIFDGVFTWNDDLVGLSGFYKINFPQYFSEFTNSKSDEFEQKKLLVNISMDKASTHPSELYTSRLKVIKYFERVGENDFDFYGKRWCGDYRNYKGECISKSEIYANYRFALCFENMRGVKGYITEKIFDCFKAGIVPIYWGAENIGEYIPDDSYIDFRCFSSIEEMHRSLKKIDRDVHHSYILAAKSFLLSDYKSPFQSKFMCGQIDKALDSVDKVVSPGLLTRTEISLVVCLRYILCQIKSVLKAFLK